MIRVQGGEGMADFDYPLQRPTPDTFRILVVDDEEPIRGMLHSFLTMRGYGVETACDGAEAVEAVERARYDLLLLDLKMPRMEGLEALKEIKRRDPSVSVLIMTAYGTVATAVEAMKAGADDYLLKPLSLDALGLAVDRERRHRAWREEALALRAQMAARDRDRGIITRNRKMLEVLDLVARVAPLPATVLIQGESGTGKELIARAIHAGGPRARGRFVALNCAVIPPTLLESELFGYERGAFTGAEARKIGYFEVAHSGTIFLDEISEMSPELQAKLLRVVQERVFQRLGGTEEVKADVRIIASSNRDLEGEVKRGRFRRDLFYRLNVIRIDVPPLRERPEDIPLLAQHFAAKYAREFRRELQGVAPEALELLMRHRWEGNVRELENVMERAVAVCSDGLITVRDLPQELAGSASTLEPVGELLPYQEAKRHFEALYLRRALERTRGNVALAARLTGIPRQNLHAKLRSHGIDRRDFAPPKPGPSPGG